MIAGWAVERKNGRIKEKRSGWPSIRHWAAAVLCPSPPSFTHHEPVLWYFISCHDHVLLLFGRFLPGAVQADGPQGSTTTPWAQCDRCLKWRRMPWFVDAARLSLSWYCENNTHDPERASCDVRGVISCECFLLLPSDFHFYYYYYYFYFLFFISFLTSIGAPLTTAFLTCSANLWSRIGKCIYYKSMRCMRRDWLIISLRQFRGMASS